MIAAQNEFQMPPKPTAEKLNGPQKLVRDVIDWASNFDKGWTKKLLKYKLSVQNCIHPMTIKDLVKTD